MSSLRFPSIHWQHRSQLSEDSMHSLLISLLRGMAALQVALAHLRAEVFPGLSAIAEPTLYYKVFAFATGFAHQAVVVFFLISGWLVGGSLLNKIGHKQAVHAYAIDRLTRLWTVMVPALLFMVVVGLVSGQIDMARPDPGSATNDFSLVSFAGNLFGLQTVVVPNFGGNFALWSLANETWYYIAFPLLLLVFLGRGPLQQVGSMAALALIAAFLPGPITLFFSIWLLGVVFSRVRIECGNGFRIALVLLIGALSAYYRIFGSTDDLTYSSYLQDLVCALPIVALLSSMQYQVDQSSPAMRGLGKFSKFFSDFSFTLYVTHLPAIDLLRYLGRTMFGRDSLSPNEPLDYAVYFGMSALMVAISYLSYLLFESQTYRVRRKLKTLLLPPAQKATRVPAMSTD